MDFSVIIVNYNVRHFLEQCLCSVRQAATGVSVEVIVVDNHSADGSVEALRPAFPEVKWIVNTENIGFARACNQGWAAATGQYIVFLNPDTLLPESVFSDCRQFFQGHPEAGAVGLRMLDGSGRFLPESKRAFPGPATAFYKLTGLARLFPRSRRFARYHLGHLSEQENHPVDVLAGAFMCIRREVLEKTGGFDETFFMYGEDVDLSYRIRQAGYENYYLAHPPLVHFKGESTRKGTLNYVRLFYKAMSIFVRKHYGARRAGLFIFFLQLAIWFRAALSAAGSFIRRFGLPLIDAGLILLSFWLVKEGWNNWVRTDIRYENRLLWIAFPAYTVFYLVAAYYAGLYDRWYRWSELMRSSAVAMVLLLAAYALLPEQYRFSRAILLFGGILAFGLISLSRWWLLQTGVLDQDRQHGSGRQLLIAGSPAEYEEALRILEGAGLRNQVLGRLSPAPGDHSAIAGVEQLKDLPSIIPAQEVVFCQGELSYTRIIELLTQLPRGIRASIHAAGSNSIVGSRSHNHAGEALTALSGYRLADPYYRRLKRLMDVFLSVFFLLSFPIHLFFVKKPLRFFRQAWLVLTGSKTWIGYAGKGQGLPPLRTGVLGSNGLPPGPSQPWATENLRLVDEWYVRDYEPAAEWKMIWKAYRRLGG